MIFYHMYLKCLWLYENVYLYIYFLAYLYGSISICLCVSVCLSAQLSSCALFNFFFPETCWSHVINIQPLQWPFVCSSWEVPPTCDRNLWVSMAPKKYCRQSLKNYFFDQFWTLNIADCWKYRLLLSQVRCQNY